MISDIDVDISWRVREGGASLQSLVGRHIITPNEQLPGSGVVYRSSFILNTLRNVDSANYECDVTVSHTSNFVASGQNSASVDITVQCKYLHVRTLSLTNKKRVLCFTDVLYFSLLGLHLTFPFVGIKLPMHTLQVSLQPCSPPLALLLAPMLSPTSVLLLQTFRGDHSS